MQAVDILILSNGPGEVTTWVRPVVRELRQILGDDRAKVRISVILSPCPNATGKEAAIALSYPEVDRVQAAQHFWQFLLRGRTVENWDWRQRGVVVFLGGDQFFTVVIGKRLKYTTVVYAEWEARWLRWIDRFGVMKSDVARVPQQYAHKFTVVGDLMVAAGRELRELENVLDAQSELRTPNSELKTQNSKLKTELVGLLPGSKPAKLAQGVPLSLAIAERIHAVRPQTRFVIPVAPTIDLATLASFADGRNPVVQLVGGTTAELIFQPSAFSFQPLEKSPWLKTATGLYVELWTGFPAYDVLSQCHLCLTTVGANTAELGALAVPMIVLVPTQQLEAMRTWDGVPGLLANLPGVGTPLAKALNWLALRRLGLLAWPNIWAQEEVVPELIGQLQPQAVAELVLDFLTHPEKLQKIRDRLLSIRGEPRAAQKLATLVLEVLSFEF